MIEIDGTLVGGTDILPIATSGVTVAGLAIHHGTGYAIALSSNISNIHIWGNYLGTDATGTTTGIGNNGGIVCNLGSFGNFSTNITIGTNGDGTNAESNGL